MSLTFKRIQDSNGATPDEINTILKDQVNSTTKLVDQDGVVTEIRYGVWGETRFTTPNTTVDTNKNYTGQEKAGNNFLIFYQSRWYDPTLGRFIQPDTIVSDPYNPLALDRYAYVHNNPINYYDPSGFTPACGFKYSDPECAIIYNMKGKLTNQDLYNVLMRIGFFVTIDIKNIPNPEGNPIGYAEGAISFYLQLRRAVFGVSRWKFISVTGQIDDRVIRATIIFGEIGTLEGNMLNEALEAVSNQYFSDANPSGNMLCKGACTIETQIAWLSDMEFVRNEKMLTDIINRSLWESQLANADLVGQPGGYQFGEDSSWFWGDVTEDELDDYYVVNKIASDYPNKDWFIVHKGHVRKGAQQ